MFRNFAIYMVLLALTWSSILSAVDPVWFALQPSGGSAGVNGDVYAIAPYNGGVVVGGSFTSAGGVSASNIAWWDGVNWFPLGAGTDDVVRTIAVSGTDIYVGGNFDYAGGKNVRCIAKWDGSDWSALGFGVNGTVSSLAIVGNEVYAGGVFLRANNSLASEVVAQRIARWNGTTWSALGSGTDAAVLSLAPTSIGVYAGGDFITAGGINVFRIAYWNGTSWSALNSGANNSVNALANVYTTLYAGGSFGTIDGVANPAIASWSGSNWSGLGSGANAKVAALTVSRGRLFAGGNFTTMNGVNANRIAQWNGTTWSSLGAGLNGSVNAITVAGDSLYVGGSFTTAGGVSASSVARVIIDQHPSVPADVDVAVNTVAENATIGSTVGITANAVDPEGSSIFYSLSDSASGRFVINASSGVVTVASALDFETSVSHSITVVASDGLLTSNQTFSIAVTNVNDVAPILITDGDVAVNAVAENAAVGSTVGITANAVDPEGSSISYSLTDSASGRFSIDSVTGVVTVGSTLDYETSTSHSITIVASDGLLTSNQTFSIAITNVNDVAPTLVTDLDAEVNTVAENAAVGSTVGIAANAVDPEGASISYSLSDSAVGHFTINASSGVVTVASSLDYETSTSHSITVVASDGLLTSSQTFSISVTNINDVAPMLVTDLDAAVNAVAENAAVDSTVGITANAVDPEGSSISYSLSDSASGHFTINASSGVVTVASALDYETSTSHSITIVASDGLLTSSQTFSIAVTNVNDVAPTLVADLDAAVNVIAENATIGSTVSITANAGDPEGSSISYSLSDNTSGHFTINASSGVVTVASALDYETSISHSITIVASDGLLTSSQSFNIAVINVNDVVPTLVTDGDVAANAVAENATLGSTVGITANAVDPEGSSVSYGLFDNASGHFAIDSVSGVVTVASALDYEASTSHLITIIASDGLLTSSQTFNIAVTNINDVAPALVADVDVAVNTVAENATIGSTVGITANAVDPEGASISYSLSDSASGHFIINSSSGVVTVASALDFETATTHSIAVVASDGLLTSSQTFSIAITNVNDAVLGPISDNDSTIDAISENAVIGSAVGITASSSDSEGAIISYSLSNNDGGRFAIDSASGVVTIAGPLSGFAGERTISVVASNGVSSNTQIFFIMVVAEEASVASDSSSSNQNCGLGGGVAGLGVSLLMCLFLLRLRQQQDQR